jgi:hypothetical protein
MDNGVQRHPNTQKNDNKCSELLSR